MSEIIFLSVESEGAILTELKSISIEGIIIGNPIPIDNASDVLDAPLNPDDITQGLEIVKVIFQTGTSIAAFCATVIKLLKEKNAKAKVKSKKGMRIIDEKTSVDDFQNFISE